jgi:hypothetical protein
MAICTYDELSIEWELILTSSYSPQWAAFADSCILDLYGSEIYDWSIDDNPWNDLFLTLCGK